MVVPHFHPILHIHHEVVLSLLLAEVTCLARRPSWEMESGIHHDFTLSHSRGRRALAGIRTQFIRDCQGSVDRREMKDSPVGGARRLPAF